MNVIISQKFMFVNIQSFINKSHRNCMFADLHHDGQESAEFRTESHLLD